MSKEKRLEKKTAKKLAKETKTKLKHTLVEGPKEEIKPKQNKPTNSDFISF